MTEWFVLRGAHHGLQVGNTRYTSAQAAMDGISLDYHYSGGDDLLVVRCTEEVVAHSERRPRPESWRPEWISNSSVAEETPSPDADATGGHPESSSGPRNPGSSQPGAEGGLPASGPPPRPPLTVERITERLQSQIRALLDASRKDRLRRIRYLRKAYELQQVLRWIEAGGPE